MEGAAIFQRLLKPTSKQMKTILAGISLLLCLQWASAQQDYPSGMLFEDERYDSLSVISDDIEGAKFLPQRVDLTPFAPAIRNQGEIFSCVGWSVGYAALTIERAIQNNWTDRHYINENANSALFIYNQIKRQTCSGGSQITAALELLETKGNCLAQEFDFNINDCNKQPDNSILQAAQQYKISHSIKLFEKHDEAALKIQKVKRVLAHRKPVIIGMKMLRNFYKLEGARFWWPNIGDQTFAGGHAMCVVGYDEEQRAFKLMNSWGKNWGNQGFIWVKYQHFADYCKYAYAIFLNEGEAIDFDKPEATNPSIAANLNLSAANNNPTIAAKRQLRELSGKFNFQKFVGWGSDNKPTFEIAAVELDKNIYQLTKQAQLGDRFQLLAETGFDNGYVYVFSVDAVGKTEVHFPKKESLNKKFTGKNETALLLSGGSKLTIPSKTKVLKLRQTGDDYLICLFSEKRIKPRFIQFLCAELSDKRTNLLPALQQLLGKHFIPAGDVTFESGQMAFSVQTRSKGSIVPIVLKVVTK